VTTAHIHGLIGAAASLWAGESGRQCFKEFWGLGREQVRSRRRGPRPAQGSARPTDERIAAIERGDIRPIEFDYRRAQLPA
jgi:hypothetical protein